MKEYLKPEVEYIDFASENITTGVIGSIEEPDIPEDDQSS